MDTPLVSVIVPVYKVERWLDQCVTSICAQTLRELEIILVDDGSPDNCGAMCDAWAEKDPRIRVIHQKNGGLSAARNAGVDVARGAYIGFVDSDDLIRPEMYERMVKQAKAHNADLVICGCQHIDEYDQPLPFRHCVEQEEILTGEEMLERLGRPDKYSSVCAWERLYTRKLARQVRFPVGHWHEDEYTAHLYYARCKKIVICPECFYLYRQLSASFTHKSYAASRLDGPCALLDRAEFFRQRGEESQRHTAFINAYGTLVDGFSQMNRQLCREQARPLMIQTLRGLIQYRDLRSAKLILCYLRCRLFGPKSKT